MPSPRGAIARSVTQEGQALYVAHVVAVEPARRDSFVAYLRWSQLPLWRALKRHRYLAGVAVTALRHRRCVGLVTRLTMSVR
jgi:hypothetical protein